LPVLSTLLKWAFQANSTHRYLLACAVAFGSINNSFIRVKNLNKGLLVRKFQLERYIDKHTHWWIGL
jgi:hypothetical protein